MGPRYRKILQAEPWLVDHGIHEPHCTCLWASPFELRYKQTPFELHSTAARHLCACSTGWDQNNWRASGDDTVGNSLRMNCRCGGHRAAEPY